MPDDHRQLARRCYRGNVLPPPRGDTLEERAKRTRGASRSPRGFDEHSSSLTASLFGDPAMIGGTFTRLANARIQAKIANQLQWLPEPTDVSDSRRDTI